MWHWEVRWFGWWGDSAVGSGGATSEEAAARERARQAQRESIWKDLAYVQSVFAEVEAAKKHVPKVPQRERREYTNLYDKFSDQEIERLSEGLCPYCGHYADWIELPEETPGTTLKNYECVICHGSWRISRFGKVVVRTRPDLAF